MKRPTRRSTSGRRGHPTTGELYRDAVLRDNVVRLHARLGGRCTMAELYDRAIEEDLFPPAIQKRFMRRAAIDFMRGALSENSPETHLPQAKPVAGVWIQLMLMTAEEWAAMVVEVIKSFTADYSEGRRLYEAGAERFGREAMPDFPDLLMPMA